MYTLHLTGSQTLAVPGAIPQGSTYAFRVFLPATDGSPFDLTGYTGSAKLRHNYSDLNASASFTCSVLTPPTSGNLQLDLSSAQTTPLSASFYHWDCEIASGTVVYRVLQGMAEVSAEATK